MDKWHYKQWQHNTFNSIFIFCFYFHQKTALLSLFQTTFFPLHACCCCCSFFLCPAIRQCKACMPNAGWTQKMLKASHSACWGSWLMYTLLWAMQVWICVRVTAWEDWWSPSLWVKPAQQHSVLSRARGRMGKGPHVWGAAWSLSSSRGTIPTSNISSASRGYLCGFFSFELGNFPGYGASGLSALRPAGTKHRQHTPSPKKAEERHAPPESNYIWWTPTSEMVHVTQSS